jgi:hypothetical protein
LSQNRGAVAIDPESFVALRLSSINCRIGGGVDQRGRWMIADCAGYCRRIGDIHGSTIETGRRTTSRGDELMPDLAIGAKD